MFKGMGVGSEGSTKPTGDILFSSDSKDNLETDAEAVCG